MATFSRVGFDTVPWDRDGSKAERVGGPQVVPMVSSAAEAASEADAVLIPAPHIPQPAATSLEDLAPSADRIYEMVSKSVERRSDT